MTLLSIPVQRIIIPYIFVDDDFYSCYLELLDIARINLVDVKWLFDTFKPRLEIDTDKIIHLIKKTSRDDFLEILFSRLKPDIQRKLPYGHLYRHNVIAGNRGCAQFFRKYYKSPDRESELTYITGDMSRWNEDIFSWICDDFNIDLNYVRNNKKFVYNICTRGKMSVIMHFVERFGIEYELLLSNYIYIFIHRDMVGLIKWIVKKFNLPKNYFMNPDIIETIYRTDAINIFKYLFQEFEMTKDECIGINCEYFNLIYEGSFTRVASFIKGKFSLPANTQGMIPSIYKHVKSNINEDIDIEKNSCSWYNYDDMSDKSWDEL